jgi:hypothetical protein
LHLPNPQTILFLPSRRTQKSPMVWNYEPVIRV